MTRPHIELTRRSLWQHIKSPNDVGENVSRGLQTRCGETWSPARNISRHLTTMWHTGNTTPCVAGSCRPTETDTNKVSLPCWRESWTLASVLRAGRAAWLSSGVLRCPRGGARLWCCCPEPNQRHMYVEPSCQWQKILPTGDRGMRRCLERVVQNTTHSKV